MKRILTILYFLCALVAARAAETIHIEPECVTENHKECVFLVENAQVGESYKLVSQNGSSTINLTADAGDPTVYRSTTVSVPFTNGSNETVATYVLYKNNQPLNVRYEVKKCTAVCPNMDSDHHMLISTGGSCQLTVGEYLEQMKDILPYSTTFTVTKDNLRYGDAAFGNDDDILLNGDEQKSARYINVYSPQGDWLCRSDYQYSHGVKYTPWLRACPSFEDKVFTIDNGCTYSKWTVLGSLPESQSNLSTCRKDVSVSRVYPSSWPADMTAGTYILNWHVDVFVKEEYNCQQKIIIKAPNFDCNPPQKKTVMPSYGSCETDVELELPKTKTGCNPTISWSRTGLEKDYHVVNVNNKQSYTDNFYPSNKTYTVYWKVEFGGEVKECQSQVEVKPVSIACKDYSFLTNSASLTLAYPDVVPSHSVDWTQVKLTNKSGQDVPFTLVEQGVKADYPWGKSTLFFQTTLCKILNSVTCPVMVVKKAEPCE